LYSASRQGRNEGTAETCKLACATLYGESSKEDDNVLIGNGVICNGFLILDREGVDAAEVGCRFGVDTSLCFLRFFGVDTSFTSLSSLSTYVSSCHQKYEIGRLLFLCLHDFF
jgi:hypothetical protein